MFLFFCYFIFCSKVHLLFGFFLFFFFFFNQKTAYEMRISDWSSDVCSSDLVREDRPRQGLPLVRAYADSHAAALQELQSLRDPVEQDGARVRMRIVGIQEACGHRWKVETGSAIEIEIMNQTRDQIDRVAAHPPADMRFLDGREAQGAKIGRAHV